MGPTVLLQHLSSPSGTSHPLRAPHFPQRHLAYKYLGNHCCYTLSFAALQRGYWERRHWLRTFGSDETSDSDESNDLFELYVGDGGFAQYAGLSEDEYSQLFDEVLPLSTERRPLCCS